MAPEQSEDPAIFHIERLSQYVSIPPSCLSDPYSAVCATVLSPLLLTYFPPVKGVILSYEDVKLSSTAPSVVATISKSKSKSKSHSKHAQNDDDAEPAEPLLLRHIDEYAASFFWVTASFLVWRPVQNAYLQAHITDQAKTHITLAHLNTFPVSILAACMPSDWSWHSKETGTMKKSWDGRISDEGGWWVNGFGDKVEGELRVRIRNVEGRTDGKGKGKGFLRVEGSLISEEEIKANAAQNKAAKVRTPTNGEVMDIDSASGSDS